MRNAFARMMARGVVLLASGAALWPQSGRAQLVSIDMSGASATGSADAGRGGPIDYTLANSLDGNECGFSDACIALQSNGGGAVSGNAGNGGTITVTIPSGVWVGYPSAALVPGITAFASGGGATSYPGDPGNGGTIAETISGAITTVSSIPDGPYGTSVEIFHQQGLSPQVFQFDGGLLAYAQGGTGNQDNTNTSDAASALENSQTGGSGGTITISNGTSGQAGGSIAIGEETYPTSVSVNAAILALSVGGDAAADYNGKDRAWIVYGQGGNGGPVTVNNFGAIDTAVDNGPGMIAVSLGGGGSVASSKVGGGDGGTVMVSSSNASGTTQIPTSITTSADNSDGIVAISAGGNLIGAEEQGIAGPGGPVTVSDGTADRITTSGTLSADILASSVSGGLTQQAQNKSYPTSGGTAGTVKVTIDGALTTSGEAADGIIAQSIGAGGGVASVSSGTSYTLGSSGSPTSASSQVTVTNNGTITTSGGTGSGAVPQAGSATGNTDSIAILAQSIAGGGGIAYLADADTQATVGSTAPTGSGGAGNDAGSVTVINDGVLTTDQQGADAILAQSVGGGGGDGKGQGWFIRYGSTGGSGGTGGAVTVTDNASITTSGWQANGIVAQSIGGGGGAGGNASGFLAALGGSGGSGGAAGSVTVETTPGSSILVQGDDSYAVLAQAIGGGGGDGGKGSSFSLAALPSVGIGGSGGGGGAGGSATVNADGSITVGSAANATGSSSIGILAQSIGGGGGTGGAGKAEDADLISVATAVGGSGGTGGAGGPAQVNLSGGSITTSGNDGYGAVAQSIGGGGGNGGESAARSLAAFGNSALPAISVAISVGGSAGGGGAGGSASIVATDSAVTTNAVGGIGLIAQSVGGGGGTAGDSTATAATVLSAPGAIHPAAISVAVGGSGGSGGAGNQASITMTGGSVETAGDHADGLFAQSIGGGGGIGGAGDANALAPTYLPGVTAKFAVGGSNGDGGAGGAASATLDQGGKIVTAGSGSYGLFVQSVGGGGGTADGGTAGGASATTGSTDNTYAFSLALGGSGGKGGAGSQASASNEGSSIVTLGGSATGIFAQSIGGGGGEGGSSDPNAALESADPLEYLGILYGDGSKAYEALKDGFTFGSAYSAYSQFESYDLAVNIGGRGGSGGDGGAVTVTNSGLVASSGTTATAATINTSGAYAAGILAQSVGGGGGAGGEATSTALDAHDEEFKDSITLALGGDGGTSGSGGSVTVTNGSPPPTNSSSSGSTGSTTNTPILDPNLSVIQTRGAQALGILAQSIGGGGGYGAAGGISTGGIVSLGSGGSGGDAGGGGAVTVNNEGIIETQGADSLAILAQSVGGGGGFAASGAITATQTSVPLKVTLGGSGGSGGAGNTVNVYVEPGSVSTSGDRAIGVVAQSIGGGGGVGATGSYKTFIGSTYAIGATNGASSAGGEANVTVETPPGLMETPQTGKTPTGIHTSGAGAWGILAQSVGGGGGLTGDTSLPPIVTGLLPSTDRPETALAGGDGGAVSVTVDNATVSTTGANADGIVAQSVGGGGGIVHDTFGNSGGSGSAGSVTVSIGSGGLVSATGSGSIGILAQSVGAGSSGSITITVGGRVMGGTNAGVSSGSLGAAGIAAFGDINATPLEIDISQAGLVTTADGIRGTAILGAYQQLTVNNAGVITGSINTGSANDLNDANSIFNTGLINLGSTLSSYFLSNYGTIAIGNAMSAAPSLANFVNPSSAVPYVTTSSVMTANLTAGQNAPGVGGEIVTGVDMAHQTGKGIGTSDDVTLSDVFNGTSLLQINPVTLLPAISANVFAMTAGHITSYTAGAVSSLGVIFLVEPLLYDYAFSKPAITNGLATFSVSASAHFTSVPGLSFTTSEAGSAALLQNQWNAGSAGPAAAGWSQNYQEQIGTVFAALASANASSYQTALNTLTPQITSANVNDARGSAQALASATQSCPAFEGDTALLSEGSCVWERTVGRWASQNDSSSGMGYTGQGVDFMLGGQKEIAPDWFLGGVASYNETWFQSSDKLESENGQTGAAAVTLKREMGQWLFSASLVGGGGSFSNSRVVEIPNLLTDTAESSNALGYGLARLRAAYEFIRGPWYAKPELDLDGAYIHEGGHTESGAGALDLQVGSAGKGFFAASPQVEFGRRIDLDDGLTIRPHLTLGMALLSAHNWETPVRLLSAPTGGYTDVSSPLPNILGSVDVGVDLHKRSGWEAKLDYGTNVGGDYTNQTFTLRLAYRF